MKIIIGLGNPGEKYKGTRHNAGFMITGSLASKYGIDGKFDAKFNAMVGKGRIDDQDIFIVQPMTFMNLSGQAVAKFLNWYKIEPNQIFVVHDDVHLDIGRIRFRPSGSDGGHNGVKSIIENLGGFKDFPRLKVGVGPDPGGLLRQSYVLQEFTRDEKEILDKIIPVCVEGIEIFLKHGIQRARNDFNGIDFSNDNSD